MSADNQQERSNYTANQYLIALIPPEALGKSVSFELYAKTDQEAIKWWKGRLTKSLST